MAHERGARGWFSGSTPNKPGILKRQPDRWGGPAWVSDSAVELCTRGGPCGQVVRWGRLVTREGRACAMEHGAAVGWQSMHVAM